jgi:hypothetical protein
MNDKKPEPIRIKTAREFWTENGAGKVQSIKDHVDESIRKNGKPSPKK